MRLEQALVVSKLESYLTTILAILCVLAWSSRPAAAQFTEPRPQVIKELKHDISPNLRDIAPVVPSPASEDVDPPRPTHPLGALSAAGTEFDPVIQKSIGPLVGTTAGLNFDVIAANGLAPPDTNGAVGATQFVEWVNTQIAVYDKLNGALLMGPTPGNSLWSGFGGHCQGFNSGDPIAQYDKVAARWVLTQAAFAPPYLVCVAVSTTPDATGSYNRYAFSMPNFPDYPKLGVWPDAYYMSFNMFSGITFLGARTCALDRNAMLAGAAATAICFQLSPTFGSLLPSDLDGTNSPPAGSNDYYLNFGTNSLNLWDFHVDFATPSNSTFTGPTNIPVAAFSEACKGAVCIPQLGTTQKLYSLGDRLMYRLAYRNLGDHESLVVNHSVTAGTSTGTRWYEIQNPGGTPTVFQQGTFAPDANFRWMGSIAMDRAGDIAVGYSVSSATINPAIRYTGRVTTDPLGTLETENSIVEGTGSQIGTPRWGDYTSMSIDPTDDCTFWYSNEYLNTSGKVEWITRVASFSFPACSSAGMPDFSLSASPASQTVTQGSGTNYTAIATSTNGFAGSVTFSVSGLPSGASANFSPSSVTGSGASSMTVLTSSTTPAGNYLLTITGTSGTLSQTASVTLIVTAVNGQEFSIAVTPASRSVAAGSNTSYTVTVTPSGGFTGKVTFSVRGLPSMAGGSFSPQSVKGGGSSTLTVTTRAKTPKETSALIVSGASTGREHSTTITVTVN